MIVACDFTLSAYNDNTTDTSARPSYLAFYMEVAGETPVVIATVDKEFALDVLEEVEDLANLSGGYDYYRSLDPKSRREYICNADIKDWCRGPMRHINNPSSVDMYAAQMKTILINNPNLDIKFFVRYLTV